MRVNLLSSSNCSIRPNEDLKILKVFSSPTADKSNFDGKVKSGVRFPGYGDMKNQLLLWQHNSKNEKI